MSREEEIAKIDEELQKLGEATEEPETEEEIEEDEEAEEPVKTEEEPKDPPKEKEPLKLEVKDLPESSGWYKAREEARKREALEKEVEELKKPKISKEENYEAHIEQEIGTTKQELAELKEWKRKQEESRELEEQREGAFRELRGYESEAAQAFPDFQEASNYAKSMIAASIKLLEPDLSPEQLAEKTIYKYAQHAASALNAKKHPGQAIYEMAGQWGYKKAPLEIKQDNRPTITKIGENKKKSSGMSGSGGNGKAFITNDALSAMTNAERMKLSESDWARLEAEG